jgi:hypothetical protein
MLPLLAGILGRSPRVRCFTLSDGDSNSRTLLRRRLLISSIAVVGALLAATTTGGAASSAPATARAMAVQVVVPGAATTQGGSSGSGSYAYRDLVSVGSYTVSTTLTARSSTAVSQLSGISLLGGIVQISALSAAIRSTATGTNAPVGDFGGAIGSITVNGAGVGSSPGARIDIPDLGYATVDQRIVRSQPGADAYRGTELAFTLHLDVGWHDMPAGTEVIVGYADAGISRVEAEPDRGGQAAPPAPATTTTPSSATPGGDNGVSLLPTAPLPTDIAGEPGIADGGPPGSDATPPGGYTLDPPIDPAVKAGLL